MRRLFLITFLLSICLTVIACSDSGSSAPGDSGVSGGGRAGVKASGGAGSEMGGSGGNSPDTGEGGRQGGSGASGQAGTGTGHGGSSGTGTSCTPPALGELIGWAATAGNDVPTTTGGGDVAPVVATTLAQLSDLAKGSVARVIHVQGNITGSVSVGSNKTLVGVCGASITGHVHLSGSVNVIIGNLKIVGNNCSDSPADCSSGADAVSVTNGAHHLWFDHCDISDGSDGNLDINEGSDWVTISYTKFSYSSARTDPVKGASGHRFSNLIGSGDDVAADVGHLNVTFHHNWWADNVDQRMPRTRRGKIHVFNNLFTSEGNSYCTNAGFEAAVRVEHNAYIGVNNPLSPDANSIGLESIGNEFVDTTGKKEGLRSSFVPPYKYSLDPTDTLPNKLRTEVGPK